MPRADRSAFLRERLRPGHDEWIATRAACATTWSIAIQGAATTAGGAVLPGPAAATTRRAEWAVGAAAGGRQNTAAESYVSLIPTTQGGTHVNGTAVGRDRRPCAWIPASSVTCCRGVELAPDDVVGPGSATYVNRPSCATRSSSSRP